MERIYSPLSLFKGSVIVSRIGLVVVPVVDIVVESSDIREKEGIFIKSS